jgi:hypothetical protein
LQFGGKPQDLKPAHWLEIVEEVPMKSTVRRFEHKAVMRPLTSIAQTTEEEPQTGPRFLRIDQPAEAELMVLMRPVQRKFKSINYSEVKDFMPPRAHSPSARRDQEETQRLIEEENHRLEMLRRDPDWSYKQSLAYRVKVRQEELKGLEEKVKEAERRHVEDSDNIEKIYKRHTAEMTGKKQKAALEALAAFDARIDAATAESQDSLEDFLATTGKLLEEVNARQLKAQEAAVSPRSGKSQGRRPQKSERNLPKLMPAEVKQRKLNWKDSNIEASVTKGISAAYDLAGRAIQESINVRRVLRQTTPKP